MEKLWYEEKDRHEKFSCAICKKEFEIADEDGFSYMVWYKNKKYCRTCFNKDVLKHGTKWECFASGIVASVFSDEEFDENEYDVDTIFEIDPEDEEESNEVMDYCTDLISSSKKNKVVVDMVEYDEKTHKITLEILIQDRAT